MLPCTALSSLTMQLISFAEPTVTCAPLVGALLTISFRISQAMCSATILLSPFVNYGALSASAVVSEKPVIERRQRTDRSMISGIRPVHAAGYPSTLPSMGNVQDAEFNHCV